MGGQPLTVAAGHVPLAVATRGGTVESIHYGSIAVVDAGGRLVWFAGDPGFVTFTRSALKPFQALPLVAAGGLERLGFGDRELAVICASHSGEPRHVAIVADILSRIGASPEDLACGVHEPYFYRDRGERPPADAEFTPLHHNCSGKHAGMLAWCRLAGVSSDDYLAPGHPVQQVVRAAVAAVTGVAEDRLVEGIDGCSAPNYAVPLERLAHAFARLAAAARDSPAGDPLGRVFAAMSSHPALVSGERTLDLALGLAGRGEWLAKVGAEGVQSLAVRSHRWGIAIKIADGAARAREPVAVEVLAQLGLLDAEQAGMLARWRTQALLNVRLRPTGRVMPVFRLQRGA